MSSHYAPAAPPGHTRVLACVLCQYRKIKCDRKFPCINCVKANVTCSPRTPAPTRKHRRPYQALQERLARCEELLKQFAGSSGPAQQQDQSHATPVTSGTKPEQMDSKLMSVGFPESWKPACKMINEDGGVRFLDSYIWATISEELHAMRDIVETEDPEDSSVLGCEKPTPDNNSDLFFSADLSTAKLEDLTPDPIRGFKLWQVFLDRVNPLTKVIHVPTVQPYVMEATTNMGRLPLHAQALLFSIYNMGALSLTDAECIQMFDITRETAMQKFTAGTKVALIRFNFLENYDMNALQALFLFLLSLQRRCDRHAAWILSGTIVRIAQKMGYHRDGELLNLNPFETEMRRRIWWQIVIQDSNYAMMSGLSQFMQPMACDTRLPQNVNDADIFPGSTVPIQPREGPTEMAFCLLLNETYKFKMANVNSNDAPAFEAAVLGQDLEGNDDSSALHQTIFERFSVQAEGLEKKLIELESKYIDINAGNVHKAALTIRPMLANKLAEILMPMRKQPEWGTEIFGPKDNLFKLLIIGNEHKLDTFERLKDTGFLWSIKLHFQLDVFAVMTGQLCQRPTGSLADRGWAVVERLYSHLPELLDMSQKQYSVQAQFALMAWKIRKEAYSQVGQTVQTPQFIMRLRDVLPYHKSHSSALSPATQSKISQPRLPQQKPQEQQQHQTMQLQPPSAVMSPFLGGQLDMPALNWDMFGGMVGNSGHQLSAALFGSLDFGITPNMGNKDAMDNMGNPSNFG